jgi:hypothetical protein
VKLYTMAHPHDSPFHSFLAKMEVAVEMDVSLNRAGKPAIEKLLMLPRLWAVIHSPAAASKKIIGKSITTNPGYFSSGRFFNGEGVERLLFPQLGHL